MCGHLPILKYLIEKYGVDTITNAVAVDDYNVLHTACQRGHVDIVKFLTDECNVDASAVTKVIIITFLPFSRYSV